MCVCVCVCVCPNDKTKTAETKIANKDNDSFARTPRYVSAASCTVYFERNVVRHISIVLIVSDVPAVRTDALVSDNRQVCNHLQHIIQVN